MAIPHSTKVLCILATKVMKKNIYFWLLIVFLIIFSTSQILIKSDLTLGWDEARHANSAHIWYDYYKTLLSGDFKSYESFLKEYEQKGYNIRWYGIFDPPFQGMWTGAWFLFLGDSIIIARISILFLVVAGSFLLFQLARKILKKDYLALSVVFLYLLSPLVNEHVTEVILGIPIAMSVIAWYYFTFHRKKSKLDYFWGAISLTIGALMKYHILIIITAFIGVYLAYLLIKRNKKAFKKYFIVYLFQGITYLIIAGYWIWYSLLKHNIWQRMLQEGTGHGFESWFFYITSLWSHTWGLIFFIIFIPIVWKEVNKRMLLFIATIIITATFIIKNQQIRYVSFLIPLVYIFIVLGINNFSEWLSHNRWENINRSMVFGMLIILSISGSIFFCYKDTMERKILVNGYQDYELFDYMKSVPLPRFFINLKTKADIDNSGYYYNPDQFIFLTMMANPESNPIYMQQFSQYIDWKYVQNPEGIIKNYEKFPGSVSYIMFKYERPGSEGMIATMEPLFEKYNYTKKELRWWIIWHS